MTDLPDYMTLAKDSPAESAARKYKFKQVIKSKGWENNQAWHTNVNDMMKLATGFKEQSHGVFTIIYHPDTGYISLIAYKNPDDARAAKAYFTFLNLGEWPLLRESETSKIDYMGAVRDIVGRR